MPSALAGVTGGVILVVETIDRDENETAPFSASAMPSLADMSQSACTLLHRRSRTVNAHCAGALMRCRRHNVRAY